MGLDSVIDFSKVPLTTRFIKNELNCSETTAFVVAGAVKVAQVFGGFGGAIGGVALGLNIFDVTDSTPVLKTIGIGGASMVFSAAAAAVAVTAISYGLVKAAGSCLGSRKVSYSAVPES